MPAELIVFAVMGMPFLLLGAIILDKAKTRYEVFFGLLGISFGVIVFIAVFFSCLSGAGKQKKHGDFPATVYSVISTALSFLRQAQ